MTSLESFNAPGGWERLEGSTNPDCIVEIYKSYEGEPNVFLSVQAGRNGFSVNAHAESRTSGPNLSEIGVYATVESALEAMVEESHRWDDRIRKIEDESLKPSDAERRKKHAVKRAERKWLAIVPIAGFVLGLTVGYLIHNDTYRGVSQGLIAGFLVGVLVYLREKKRQK